ncbi:MAG: ribosome assembly RNA-binding protein YhbY [Candidatus Cloacimonadota bacterium]|nr:MAG: ribosome assembly RNA-binding protein YhbY [Candidatus Cloacimonadota bacterium]
MLTGQQKMKLRKLAHDLKPVIMIGKTGFSESVKTALEEALEAHELIKLKFIDFKEEKKNMAYKIAAESGADIVGLIGNILILYRPCSDENKRKIKLNQVS